jgi:cysteine desulfurase
MIYLDNASTTPLSPPVLRAMLPFMSCGNPSSLHSCGREAREAVENAREQVARAIGAEPNQIIFTSGGAESNAMVMRGALRHCRFSGRPKMAASAVEHDSILRYADYSVPVRKSGTLDPSKLGEIIDNKTSLLCAMYVNNETGAINDVTGIAEFCSKKDITFTTDCVQALGSVPINVKLMGCDFATFSAHKIHGPKGVGAVYAKHPALLDPLIKGGDDQEFGMRGGTPNVAGIVGFGVAAELASKLEEEKSCWVYKDLFVDKLVRALGSADSIKVNEAFPEAKGVSKILSLTIKDVDAQTLVLAMDAQDICISAGAACSSSSSEPSHVLTAIGLSPAKARQTVRISFSEANNPEEIGYAAVTMAETITKLRKKKINNPEEPVETTGFRDE